MKNTQKKSAVSVGSLVGLGNSKRLAAMRKSIKAPVESEPFKGESKKRLNNEERDIKQARQLVKQVIADIKSKYPAGQQNSFFALRYTSEEQLNQLSLQEVFELLKISQVLPKKIMQVKFAGNTDLS
ncbi:MAG: hypothetical protein methR_P0995 [Methyloprofundus sp.]|nr:MAG: hypothetical protein methR_P0995 [Methyloprofundus sp.]